MSKEMKKNILALLKEGNFDDAGDLLPAWIYDIKNETSFLIIDITSYQTFKTGKTTIFVHQTNYYEREVYSGMGGCEDDSCYGATLISDYCQDEKIIKKVIGDFLTGNYLVDEEATTKQKKALKSFGEVVIKMSKKEAQKKIQKLIEETKL
jgi:hypothetical protein